jgi:hypothetical protein
MGDVIEEGNGKMGKWEDGKMGNWENGKMDGSASAFERENIERRR